jgi:hypothetical protein
MSTIWPMLSVLIFGARVMYPLSGVTHDGTPRAKSHIPIRRHSCCAVLPPKSQCAHFALVEQYYEQLGLATPHTLWQCPRSAWVARRCSSEGLTQTSGRPDLLTMPRIPARAISMPTIEGNLSVCWPKANPQLQYRPRST